VSSAAVWLLVALALVAVLAAARLFLVKPGGGRAAPPSDLADLREALRALLADPDAAAGREAETRGEWSGARAAYARALERVREEDPSDPATVARRRALESKVEELDRRERGA
jgi:hypothetical protein